MFGTPCAGSSALAVEWGKHRTLSFVHRLFRPKDNHPTKSFLLAIKLRGERDPSVMESIMVDALRKFEIGIMIILNVNASREIVPFRIAARPFVHI